MSQLVVGASVYFLWIWMLFRRWQSALRVNVVDAVQGNAEMTARHYKQLSLAGIFSIVTAPLV